MEERWCDVIDIEDDKLRLEGWKRVGFNELAKYDRDVVIRRYAYQDLGYSEEAVTDSDWYISGQAVKSLYPNVVRLPEWYPFWEKYKDLSFYFSLHHVGYMPHWTYRIRYYIKNGMDWPKEEFRSPHWQTRLLSCWYLNRWEEGLDDENPIIRQLAIEHKEWEARRDNDRKEVESE